MQGKGSYGTSLAEHARALASGHRGLGVSVLRTLLRGHHHARQREGTGPRRAARKYPRPHGTAVVGTTTSYCVDVLALP